MEEVTGQDIVLLGVKAHQIEPIADKLSAMLAPEGVIVTLQNGIPWWYFQKLPGEYQDSIVRTVDPNGPSMSPASFAISKATATRSANSTVPNPNA